MHKESSQLISAYRVHSDSFQSIGGSKLSKNEQMGTKGYIIRDVTKHVMVTSRGPLW